MKIDIFNGMCPLLSCSKATCLIHIVLTILPTLQSLQHIDTLIGDQVRRAFWPGRSVDTIAVWPGTLIERIGLAYLVILLTRRTIERC